MRSTLARYGEAWRPRGETRTPRRRFLQQRERSVALALVGLLFGLAAAISGRRREDHRGPGAFGLVVAVFTLVLATGVVADHLPSRTEQRLPIQAVVAKANDRFVPKPDALRSLSVDGLRFRNRPRQGSTRSAGPFSIRPPERGKPRLCARKTG